ncbi:DedA family protein [Zhihengliuella salsuginis]|uniref:Membrane protein n=1 Tax=Zhihengliuella salsuginis TaxID=578222 RepID=A0ABQ3GIT5_9MICC|nr:DedA family protein [Zhihengliuella salsuginis]GHD09485.1 membrane protein [Zhihengliuella salsuginis]
MLEAINDAIMSASGEWWVLGVVFLFCGIDAFFPLVPSESLLVGLASVSVTAGTQDLVWLAVIGAVGAFLGDQVAYRMGAAIGVDRVGWMRGPRARKVLAFARRELVVRGALLVFTARFIPLGRTAVNFTAGATRYPWRRFASLDAVACTVWAAYSVAIGALAGRWFEEHKLLAVVVSVLIAFLIGYLIDRIIYAVLRRRQIRRTARGPVVGGTES